MPSRCAGLAPPASLLQHASPLHPALPACGFLLGACGAAGRGRLRAVQQQLGGACMLCFPRLPYAAAVALIFRCPYPWTDSNHAPPTPPAHHRCCGLTATHAHRNDSLTHTHMLLRPAVQGMREDFIVVHLQEPCSYCRQYMNGGMRCAGRASLPTAPVANCSSSLCVCVCVWFGGCSSAVPSSACCSPHRQAANGPGFKLV
jgi:hypothetical protein